MSQCDTPPISSPLCSSNQQHHPMAQAPPTAPTTCMHAAKRSGPPTGVSLNTDDPQAKKQRITPTIAVLCQSSTTGRLAVNTSITVRLDEGSIILELKGNIAVASPGSSTDNPSTISVPLKSVVSVTAVDKDLLLAICKK